MTYFEQLSSNTQDIIMLNFEFFGKKLLISCALILAFYYVFYYWKNKKESPYLMIGVLRIILFVCSIVCILSSPMFIFLLYPQVRLDNILAYMLIFYTIGFFVAGVIITLNMFYYGSHMVLRFANIKIDKNADKVYKNVFGETAKLLGFRLKK